MTLAGAALSGAAVPGGPVVLAGAPGAPPPPAAVAVIVALLVAAFAATALFAWTRRRREDPLRREIRARPVTFRATVNVKAGFFGTMADQHGPLYLNVHGDLFRVLHAFPPARLMFGQEYCYQARDTQIRMVPGGWHDWIEVSMQQAGAAAPIWIGRRKMNRQLWDVLVSAGAHPAGPPPAQ